MHPYTKNEKNRANYSAIMKNLIRKFHIYGAILVSALLVRSCRFCLLPQARNPKACFCYVSQTTSNQVLLLRWLLSPGLVFTSSLHFRLPARPPQDEALHRRCHVSRRAGKTEPHAVRASALLCFRRTRTQRREDMRE